MGEAVGMAVGGGLGVGVEVRLGDVTDGVGVEVNRVCDCGVDGDIRMGVLVVVIVAPTSFWKLQPAIKMVVNRSSSNVSFNVNFSSVSIFCTIHPQPFFQQSHNTTHLLNYLWVI